MAGSSRLLIAACMLATCAASSMLAGPNRVLDCVPGSQPAAGSGKACSAASNLDTGEVHQYTYHVEPQGEADVLITLSGVHGRLSIAGKVGPPVTLEVVDHGMLMLSRYTVRRDLGPYTIQVEGLAPAAAYKLTTSVHTGQRLLDPRERSLLTREFLAPESPCCKAAGSCTILRAGLGKGESDPSRDLCHTGTNLCDARGQLMALDLSGEALGCALPAAMGQLSGLTRLAAAGAGLHGDVRAVASTLRHMPMLQVLRAPHNALTGGLPCALIAPRTALLRLVDLSGNALSGPVPACVFEGRNLKVLRASHNSLAGGIEAPPQGSVASEGRQAAGPTSGSSTIQPPPVPLEELRLDHNALTGLLPATAFANTPRLRVLDLSHNKLVAAAVPPRALRELAPTMEVLKLHASGLGVAAESLAAGAALRRLDAALAAAVQRAGAAECGEMECPQAAAGSLGNWGTSSPAATGAWGHLVAVPAWAACVVTAFGVVCTLAWNALFLRGEGSAVVAATVAPTAASTVPQEGPSAPEPGCISETDNDPTSSGAAAEQPPAAESSHLSDAELLAPVTVSSVRSASLSIASPTALRRVSTAGRKPSWDCCGDETAAVLRKPSLKEEASAASVTSGVEPSSPDDTPRIRAWVGPPKPADAKKDD